MCNCNIFFSLLNASERLETLWLYCIFGIHTDWTLFHLNVLYDSLPFSPSCSVDGEVTQPFYPTHQPPSNDQLVSTETCCLLEDSSLSVEAGQRWSHQHVQQPSALMRSKALRWYKLIVSLELCPLASGWAIVIIKLHSWLGESSGSRSSLWSVGATRAHFRICEGHRWWWCS